MHRFVLCFYSNSRFGAYCVYWVDSNYSQWSRWRIETFAHPVSTIKDKRPTLNSSFVVSTFLTRILRLPRVRFWSSRPECLKKSSRSPQDASRSPQDHQAFICWTCRTILLLVGKNRSLVSCWYKPFNEFIVLTTTLNRPDPLLTRKISVSSQEMVEKTKTASPLSLSLSLSWSDVQNYCPARREQ